MGLGRIPGTQTFSSSSIRMQGHLTHKGVQVSWHALVTAGWAEDSVLKPRGPDQSRGPSLAPMLLCFMASGGSTEHTQPVSALVLRVLSTRPWRRPITIIQACLKQEAEYTGDRASRSQTSTRESKRELTGSRLRRQDGWVWMMLSRGTLFSSVGR